MNREDLFLEVISETISPINKETDPKLIKPFKKWLKQNGYTRFTD